jgi:hypothetical protein
LKVSVKTITLRLGSKVARLKLKGISCRVDTAVEHSGGMKTTSNTSPLLECKKYLLLEFFYTYFLKNEKFFFLSKNEKIM